MRTKESRLKVYLVSFDGLERYVEAHSFAQCIDVWRGAMALEWGSDYDGTEEPESVALVSDDPVISCRSDQ